MVAQVRQIPTGNPGREPQPTTAAPSNAGLRAAIGILVVVVGVAGALFVYHRIDHRVGVLVVRNNMPQGHVIGPGDLGVARIAPTPGVEAIAASAESQAIGRRAGIPLVAGQLLVTADLSSGPTLAAGQVEIGVAVSQSQVPAEGVAPGQMVNVMATIASGGSKTTAGQPPGTILATAKVLSVSRPSGGGGSVVQLVSLSVPLAAEATVGPAAAAGEVSLIPIPAGG